MRGGHDQAHRVYLCLERCDILRALKGAASRTAGRIFSVYDTTCSLVRNIPLSRSNKYVEGCATQPLLLSSP